MFGARPLSLQSAQVHGCPVALVNGKAVAWVSLVHLHQKAVPEDLGENGCGRNGGYFRVAFHDGLAADPKWWKSIPVDEHFHRGKTQPIDRSAHGQQGRLQDVETVDLFDAGLGNAAAQGLGSNFVEEGLTAVRTQGFAVGQPGNGILFVKNDGGRDNGPGQRAAACLVHTCNQARDGPVEFSLTEANGN